METLQALLGTLVNHGERPALIAVQKHEVVVWSFTQLVDLAQRLASGCAEAGLARGTPALVLAPNRPEWIFLCVALFAAAVIPVPVDSQMADDDLRHVLDDSEVRWIFTTAPVAQRLAALGLPHEVTLVLLDAAAAEAGSWQHYLAARAGALPAARPQDPAVLFYTSGTTGTPKGVPLSHANLMANLRAVLALGLIHPSDRLLLPLPLHHVYPFTVGMLAPLAVGVPIVLPASLTGPQLLRALHAGQVTAIIGVPRFYEALQAAIETRMRQQGRLAAALYHGALTASGALRRWFGWNLGRWVFAPVHKQLAPHLRAVASGGAALAPALAWQLAGLGWQVATGYGLTETSPILTCNPPGGGRLETAGKPLPGVEIRIAPAEHQGQYGEVLAKGPNVFSGYRHLPETTREAFTADGYFRTGDVGYVDGDGYLHLVGRMADLIVLPGGENVRPEAVEDMLARGAHIREAGVLAHEGRLVALIVPETGAAPQRDEEQVEQLIRHEVEQLSRALPSHHRISDYALTPDPLPRTRLGKLRRHLLAERYQQVKQPGGAPVRETGPLPLTHMSPEDQQLLEDRTAQRLWEWLAHRFPEVRLTPDSHLHLDLGIDSLAWLNLTLEIRVYAGVDLDEEAIGRIETVRDLLREALAAEQGTDRGKPPLEQLQQPAVVLSEEQRQWLQPPGPLVRALGAVLFGLNRLLLRRVFQLEVQGLEHLPQHGPCLLMPNHVSLLDPLAVAAALPKQHLQRTYWGGWTGIMFTTPLMRLVSWATRVVPIDPQRGPLSSLAFGVAALERGYTLVWFPEGGLSRTGRLQRFRPGIGLMLRIQPVPVVPVWITGSQKALPPDQWRLRRHPIRITFGKQVDAETVQRLSAGDQPPERIAAVLHNLVAELGGQGESPCEEAQARQRHLHDDTASSA